MTRADAAMLGALVASLSISAAGVALSRRSEGGQGETVVRLGKAILDASGVAVERRNYRRIASGSIVADRLLLELAEPERIVGLSRHGFEGSAVAHRYGARTVIDTGDDVESLIVLRPDLLLVNNFVDRRRIERLRGSGIIVFELGEMRGLSSLLKQIEMVSALLGAEARGKDFARGVAARLASVADDIPIAERKAGLYLGIHGTQFYGGSRGTSYHDVLHYAGLRDRAADSYKGWPSYTSEELIVLDPEIIVTPQGQGYALCRHAVLSALRACGPDGKVVEIDGRLLVDPGLSMIDAAILVREAVYGAVEGGS